MGETGGQVLVVGWRLVNVEARRLVDVEARPAALSFAVTIPKKQGTLDLTKKSIPMNFMTF